MSASTSKIVPTPPVPTSAPGSSNEQPAPPPTLPAKPVGAPHSPVAQSISQSVLFSGKIAKTLQGEEEQESNGSSGSGAITSYTGLSATTQERIRRFEQETLAMLQKDYKLNKDKDGERDRLTRDLSQSKRELEMDDKSIDSSTQGSNELRPLSSDSISSNSVNLSRLSSSNNISCTPSPPALSRSPRSPRLATRSSSTTHMKRLKTGKELETESPTSGSTDSLTIQDVTRSQSQHVLASDEGSDLLTTLTSTFDQKLKLLLKSENVTSPPSEPCESFKDPSLHRTIDLNSNKSSDSESKDKENMAVHSNVNVNNVKEVKEKSEDLRTHKTLRQTLSEMNPSECKLNRSSSLRKHDENDRKLKRTGSLNVRPSRSDSKIESRISKFEALVQNFENKNVKRSDSLSKSEKTDLNKRRQSDVKSKWSREKENVKLKRNRVSNARSIKRRHTVGGTKDFDKVNWLQREREQAEESKKERRTSSPDLSYSRLQNILSDVVMRPQSLLDTHFSSRLLESHV